MLETIPNPVSQTTKNDEARCANHGRVRLWQSYCDDASRYMKSGQHRKARQKLRAALRESTHFGEDDERLAVTLLNLIACEVELKDGELSGEAAYNLAEYAIRVHKNCHGKNSEKTASCLLNMGVLLEINGYIPQANVALEEAVSILRAQETQTRSVTTLLCHVLYNHAALLWTCDQLKSEPPEILTLADEAYKIGQAVYGSHDRLVITIKQLRDDIADNCT